MSSSIIPQSWITRYVFSQDAKVIAVQYIVIALGVGLVALVLSWLMRLQLGFPGVFAFIDANAYYQFMTMHGMMMVVYVLTALFLGGFGNYLIPLMVGARDMVFPYANMLSFWIYLVAVVILLASFFVPGGPTGAGWTLYPPQSILTGTPGRDEGIVLMLVSLMVFIIGFTLGGLNYVVTVLQARARGMTLMRMPLTVWGIFTASFMALLAFPALFVGAVMMLLDRLLGTSFFMPSLVEMGQQLDYRGGSSDPVPAPVLVLRPSGGLHRRAAGLRHRVGSHQHPCAPQHLRLPHDGVGDPGDRSAQLRGLGAPHVRERHGSLVRVLLRDHDADHRRPDRHQGVQLGPRPCGAATSISRCRCCSPWASSWPSSTAGSRVSSSATWWSTCRSRTPCSWWLISTW